MTDDERKMLLGVAKAIHGMVGPPSYYVHMAFSQRDHEQETWTDGHDELRKLIESVQVAGV